MKGIYPRWSDAGIGFTEIERIEGLMLYEYAKCSSPRALQ